MPESSSHRPEAMDMRHRMEMDLRKQQHQQQQQQQMAEHRQRLEMAGRQRQQQQVRQKLNCLLEWAGRCKFYFCLNISLNLSTSLRVSNFHNMTV